MQQDGMRCADVCLEFGHAYAGLLSRSFGMLQAALAREPKNVDAQRLCPHLTFDQAI